MPEPTVSRASMIQSSEGQQLTAESKLDKVQAGFYRMKVGAIDVIALSDGTAGFEVVEMLSKPKEAEKLLAKAYLKSPVDASVNAFLIQLGTRQILVDTGSGELLGPKLNKMPVSLKAVGVSPEQITDILLISPALGTCGKMEITIDGSRCPTRMTQRNIDDAGLPGRAITQRQST
jgi:hypothetical protein